MTAKMWIFALLGLAIFGLFQLAIPIDVCLAAANLPTISRLHLLMGTAHPYSFPPLIVSLALLPIGGFIGHYWSPANVPFWETAQMWLPALLIAPLVLFAGIVLARLFVAQTL